MNPPSHIPDDLPDFQVAHFEEGRSSITPARVNLAASPTSLPSLYTTSRPPLHVHFHGWTLLAIFHLLNSSQASLSARAVLLQNEAIAAVSSTYVIEEHHFCLNENTTSTSA